MINLIKRENLNLSILETDFDIFADIANTFSSEVLKKDCLIDLDDYIMPEYFKNKITIVIQTNGMLIGYITFEFKTKNNSTQVEISDMYVLDDFKNKGMEGLLVESVIYVAGEVGSRNIFVSVDEHDSLSLKLYKNIGFYEVGMSEEGSLLSANVSSAVTTRRLNHKFRDIPADSIDYKRLKLVKKITTGRSGNIYITSNNEILKMFTSNSFTYIKDREETLKILKKLDVNEVVKPQKLVYYDGVFVGYIMEYLPEGDSLTKLSEGLSFEEKLEKIKAIETVMKKLHQQKIYISDLNPDNIFFDNKGNIKLIDCDAFVVKNNVVNNKIEKKYQDSMYKVVSEKTDIYSFAVTCLELLANIKIDSDRNYQDIQKLYNKNKNKLPASFKNYFEKIFNTRERIYLSDFYDKYIDEMYSDSFEINPNREGSGNISVIILSLIAVIIAVIGFILIKYGG